MRYKQAMTASREEWRAVRGYEGIYEVSDCGRVRRLPGRGSPNGRMLKLCPGQGGYLQGVLCRDGTRKNVRVHLLVLDAFVGPCPPGLEGCHEDGNPAHNARTNLRWGTKNSNQDDRVRHGTTVLTHEQVREILQRYRRGLGAKLGREFGVSRQMIHLIVHRHEWRRVD